MKSDFLTEHFNPIVPKKSYFNINNLILRRYTLFLFLLITAFTSTAQNYNNIEFIQNKGQWDKRVQYKGEVSNGAFFIRSGGFTVVQHNQEDLDKFGRFGHGFKEDGTLVTANDKLVVRSHAYDVDFLGASPNLKSVPDKRIDTYNNYFIGDDPSKWASDCSIYQAITLENVYPNVDVRYYTDNGFLKYDIIAKPGADISKIALKYNGVNKLQVKNKELVVVTSVGELKESSPYTYQLTGKERIDINCKYIVKDNVVRFDIKDYDPTATLVIDPTLIFCSFSGSRTDNWGFTATYGPDGSMYGGGIVFGTGFPVSPGAFQTTYMGGLDPSDDTGPVDIGIIKLSPNGSNRIYATYIGGSGNEQPHSLIVDNAGNLIVAGRTNSPLTGGSSYPVTGGAAGIVGSCGAIDIVVTKLNAAGNALIGSKRIGGSANDGVNISPQRGQKSLQRNYGDDGRSEVILDGAGNIYVASCTQSTADPNAGNNFPVRGAVFQPTPGGAQDGVLIKLTPTLSAVTFSSFLGGTANDAAYVLSLAPNGDIYVGGGTESDSLSFPGNSAGTIGPENAGNIDGFVAVITNNGSIIRYSTFLGTTGIDQVFGVQFDNKGFPYVMGQTTGTWPVTPGVYNNAGGKQFIAKLKPDLSAYVYSTVFGSGSTTPNISPIAFLVDKCENVYISGWGGYFFNINAFNSAGTFGLPVTPDAIKSTTDGRDLYIFVLKKDAVSQLFGSFWGENNPPNAGSDHVDGGTSRFDKNGVIYQAICGNCKLGLPTHPTYPTTPGAYSTVNNANDRGGCNLTLLKIALNLTGVGSGVRSAIDGQVRDTAGCVPLKVNFSDTVRNAVSYEWNFGDGSPTITTTLPDTSHTYLNVGVYQVMLVAIDPNTCNVRDTSYMHIKVGDLKATVALDAIKTGDCHLFQYDFHNLSQPPPSRLFTDTSFIWDFGDGSPKVIAGLATQVHSFPAAGTYFVILTLRDTAYCNAPESDTLKLSVDINVRARISVDTIGCVPYTAHFRSTSIAGQTFEWDFGDFSPSSTDENPDHFYGTAGDYRVRLIANNPNTCNKSDTTYVTLHLFNKPIADFTNAPIPPQVNTPTVFTNLSSPDAVSFKWKFGDGDSLITTSRAPVSHQYDATATFNACLTAYNAAGCDSTVCRPVEVLIDPLVDVPNAFTPQSGDINSVIKVQGYGISKMRFIIWNRWGQKVFESNSRQRGWDGRVKGVLQPMDVYVYTLDVEFFDGKKATKKGDITLIR